MRAVIISDVAGPPVVVRVVSHFMRSFCLTIIGVGFLLVGCSRVSTELSFHSPTGWKVVHKKSGGVHSYIVGGQDTSGGFLEFSQWPVPSSREELPRLIDEVVGLYLKEASTSSKFSIASKQYRIEQFSGAQCQGCYATFRMSGVLTNTLQVILMMSMGSNVWNGQFTGPPAAWNQALDVLKSVKRDG
jgi:hypothetical protein